MKKLSRIVTAFGCLLAGIAFGQTNPQLAQTIDSLYQIDQDVQWKIMAAIENKIPFDSIQKLQELEQTIFKKHTPLIKSIYSRHGYPTIEIVGKQASSHFFVLIQHSDSDPAFQAEMLPILDKYSKEGKVSRTDYAYLYDRVQRNTGGMQLYGTQLTYDENGNLFDSSDKIIYPKDLAEPHNVDERRKEVGLEPIEQYYEQVLKMLGRPRTKK